MSSETVTQTEDWVSRARAFAPLIQQYRDESEATRRLPRPLFEAMFEAGLYKLMLPRAFGGEQLSLSATTRVIEEVARHDGAAGWNIFIGTGGGLFADYLPEDTAREVFDRGIVAGSFTPGGTAQTVDGGYRVTGMWPFASGSHNSSWFACVSTVVKDGQPVADADGSPLRILTFIPTDECEILDTWYTSGLRGTGSNHFQALDVLVPTQRTVPFVQLFRGPRTRASTAYHCSFFPLQSPLMTAVSLGIARDAIESFKELALAKTPSRATKALWERPTAQDTLGRAEALLRAARASVYAEAARFEALVRPTPEEATAADMHLRLACIHAANACIEAVDLLFEAAGGTSIYVTSRLERCFRDVHVVTHHQGIAPSRLDEIGAYLMGPDRHAEADPAPSRLHNLEQVIEQHRDESEAQRQMAKPLFDAMQTAGIFDTMRPRAYGGAQVSVEEQTHIVEDVARLDGAAAWNVMIAAHMDMLADYLPEAGAVEVFAPATHLVAGAFMPAGSATAVEGGYRVTARWPFGSGCVHADWLVGAVSVTGEEAAGARLMFMPAGRCRILDTWRTTGLRGTGSHDFEVTDISVPAHRSFPVGDLYGPPSRTGAAYLRPFFDGAAPPMAAVGLGIARHALDAFVTMAASKRQARASVNLGMQSPTHRRLARAEALLRCARESVYEAARLAGTAPDGDATAATEVSASVRLACAFAIENATQAVDIVFDAAGGTSIYETSVLERCFRDVHMVSHHALLSPTHLEMVGQYLLTGELQFRR